PAPPPAPGGGGGEPVDDLASLDESRDHLAAQLVSLPWEGLALSRDEPALSVRFIGL
ncbi:MAG TPA: nicotinate phosphoribosyltransferase, partial [Corynebacterium variabile]|nr:nicotinate phosphoribosyltransferase [Corynebacterium variabile]